MLELYKKRTNKTQYVKMSKAFRKIYLHHQALYKINNVTEFTNATKIIKIYCFMVYQKHKIFVSIKRSSQTFVLSYL